MSYMVDTLTLPPEVYSWKHVRKEKYAFYHVCKSCGAELSWEYPFYENFCTYTPASYRQRKADLEAKLRTCLSIDRQMYEEFLQDLPREWEQQPKTQELKKTALEKYQAANEHGVCPVCAARLSREKGYYMPDFQLSEASEKEWYSIDRESWKTMDTEKIFSLMAQARKPIESGQIRSAADAFVRSCDLYVSPPAAAGSLATRQSSESLQKYVLHLLHLENNIYSLKQHLTELYSRRLSNDRLLAFSTRSPIYEIRQKLHGLRARYQEIPEEIELAKARPLPEVSVAYPFKPSAPTYKTPGLFNKKKILAENEALRQKYEADLAAYNRKVRECDDEKARLLAEEQAFHDDYVRSLQEDLEEYKGLIAQAEADIANRTNTLSTCPVPARAIKTLLDREIEKTEDLLKKTFSARNALYAQNVIFEKYRDPVALSSFYEYLMTGRCNSLKGPDGAYNIYENEIRMNRVIAQLDTVITSLEEIKQNQFVMYQEMRSINTSLENLNSSMDSALTSIQTIEANTTSIHEYMEHISRNSDVIAHNSAVTAYYAKVNAELTDALGFMAALH